jgi:hypothetical protein
VAFAFTDYEHGGQAMDGELGKAIRKGSKVEFTLF